LCFFRVLSLSWSLWNWYKNLLLECSSKLGFLLRRLGSSSSSYPLPLFRLITIWINMSFISFLISFLKSSNFLCIFWYHLSKFYFKNLSFSLQPHSTSGSLLLPWTPWWIHMITHFKLKRNYFHTKIYSIRVINKFHK